MPEHKQAVSKEEVLNFIEEIGYPVWITPTFILGDNGPLQVASNEEVNAMFKTNMEASPERPLLVSKQPFKKDDKYPI